MLDFGNINNRSFVKLDYRYGIFKGYNTPIQSLTGNTASAREGISLHRGLPGITQSYTNSEDDYERYSYLNLGLNYNIKEKYNLSLNIPYHQNVDYYGKIIQLVGAPITEKVSYSGIGDLSIGLQRVFAIKSKSDTYKHLLKAGGNIFLPTGKYESEDHENGNIHMQPGRSIYALDIGVNYNIEKTGNWGINTLATHYEPFNNDNTTDGINYQFSRKEALDLNAYKLFKGTLNKALILGVKNELNAIEYIDGLDIEDTGGLVTSANLGATASKGSFLVKVEGNLPFYQNLNGLQLKNKVKFSISLMYYIKATSNVCL